jgi:hypothetical protein
LHLQVFLNADKYTQLSQASAINDLNAIKDNKYYLGICQSIMSMCYGNSLSIGYGKNGSTCLTTNRSIQEIRSYGMGKQSTVKYDKYIEMCDADADLAKNSMLNVSRDIVNIYPHQRDIISKKISEQAYKPQLYALDSGALFEKAVAHERIKFEASPKMQQIHVALTGAPKQTYSPEDIDFLEKIGGEKLEIEMSLENAINDSLANSGWDLIKEMLVYDLIDLNKAAVHVYLDKNSKKLKTKYVDIARAFYTPDIMKDHRNMSIAGYFEQTSISALEMQLKLSNEYGNDLEKLDKIIDSIGISYNGQCGNSYSNALSNWHNGSRESFINNGQSLPYMNYKVDVATIYFKASSIESFAEQRGIQTDENDALETKKTSKTSIQNIYTAKWIVGTDYVFDCGMDNTIVRYGDAGAKEAMLPIIVYGSQDISITARAISVIDDIQLAILKRRITFSKMPPDTLLVNLDAIENIEMDGGRMKAVEVLRQLTLTGIMVYRPTAVDGSYMGSQAPPIQRLPNNAMNELIQMSQYIEALISTLRQLTGINESVDGSQNSAEMAVGVTQNNQASTNASLSPLISANKNMFECICKYTAFKYQSLTATGNVTGSFFSNNTIQQYKLTKNILSNEFAINIHVVQNYEEKQRDYNSIENARAQGQVTEIDAMKIRDYIRNDQNKQARMYLAHAITKKEAADQQRQMQIQEQNAQGNLQSAQATAQADMQKIQAKGQIDMQLE